MSKIKDAEKAATIVAQRCCAQIRYWNGYNRKTMPVALPALERELRMAFYAGRKFEQKGEFDTDRD